MKHYASTDPRPGSAGIHVGSWVSPDRQGPVSHPAEKSTSRHSERSPRSEESLFSWARLARIVEEGTASAVPKSVSPLGASAPEGSDAANHTCIHFPVRPKHLSFRAESAKRGICFLLEF